MKNAMFLRINLPKHNMHHEVLCILYNHLKLDQKLQRQRRFKSYSLSNYQHNKKSELSSTLEKVGGVKPQGQTC